MAKYDLTGSLETEFTFAIGNYEFKFRKPTVREMRAVSNKFAGAEKEQDSEVQARLSEEAMAELYNFVQPIDHSQNLRDLMDNQPVGVQIAFNDMIKKELGAAQ